jgi:hypothetical protein
LVRSPPPSEGPKPYGRAAPRSEHDLSPCVASTRAVTLQVVAALRRPLSAEMRAVSEAPPANSLAPSAFVPQTPVFSNCEREGC